MSVALHWMTVLAHPILSPTTHARPQGLRTYCHPRASQSYTLDDKTFLAKEKQKISTAQTAVQPHTSQPNALTIQLLCRESNTHPTGREATTLTAGLRAHNERATLCGTYTRRVHSRLSNALLRGWTRESVKTADAIVFGVQNCLGRDSRSCCHSITFLRMARKTPFSGHFSKNFRPPFSSEICIFSQNAPFKRCSVTLKLQSL